MRSPVGSASNLFSVAVGIAANAELSGAKTVMSFALLSGSTKFATLIVLTRVDNTGFFDAAVATGAVAMPAKLPGPLLGTLAQAEPNSVPVPATGTALELALAVEEIAEEPLPVELLFDEQAARGITHATARVAIDKVRLRLGLSARSVNMIRSIPEQRGYFDWAFWVVLCAHR